MLLICADVTGRNLFNNPLPSVPELISLGVVAVVFLQLPLAVRDGRLPQSMLLLDLLSNRVPRVRLLILIGFHSISAIVMAVICFYSWPLLVKAFIRETYTGSIGSLTVALWPVKAIIVLSAATVSLQFLVKALQAVQDWREPERT